MRVLIPAALLAIFGLSFACSSNTTGANQGPVGAAGSSTGGAVASSGGRSSAGGTGTGGAGGVTPVDCGFDAGADECRVCLATHCCDDTVSCFGDPACEGAFTTYRACEKDPAELDKSKCYSSFGRSIRVDSGTEASRTRLLTCILTSCSACGGPGVL